LQRFLQRYSAFVRSSERAPPCTQKLVIKHCIGIIFRLGFRRSLFLKVESTRNFCFESRVDSNLSIEEQLFVCQCYFEHWTQASSSCIKYVFHILLRSKMDRKSLRKQRTYDCQLMIVGKNDISEAIDL